MTRYEHFTNTGDAPADQFTQTNCLTEICFDDAIVQAKSLDEFQREHGRLIGPLHGVPMSLKDQFDIEGLDSTLGYVGRAFAPATSNAVIVDVLKRLGAVVIAKTNLPQSIMVRPRRLSVQHQPLTFTVVRDRESSMGTDDASHEPEFYARWFIRRRSGSFSNPRVVGGLGNRHRRINSHPESHKRALGLKA
jgi:hypothetical protein